MKNVLRSLVLTLLVLVQFCVTKVAAETSDVHIVLATDFSSSMFMDTKHAEIQSRALHTFLADFNTSCVGVAVDFLPWGGTVDAPVGSVIKTAAEAERFWAKIAPRTIMPLGGTEHGPAFRKALSLFSHGGSTNILVFTTDEGAQVTEALHLRELVPPDVDVYAISLGGDSVFTYVDRQIASGPERHFHASSSSEFTAALKEVFQSVTNQFCLY